MARGVCPVWVGYLLASPVRKLLQNPEKILRPYVKQGMKVLDVGSAMGFFSLPLARMVGPDGKVICVDVQEKMIQSLKKRAWKAGLSNIIKPHICNQNSLGLDEFKEKVDFAFASAVVHEVPDASSFFSEVYEGIKPGGKFLVIEPKGHVTEKDFEVSILVAGKKGFSVIDHPKISRSRSALFGKG
jgi:ubiquinone/menaquinone biosynthesis C-methylase UbiE